MHSIKYSASSVLLKTGSGSLISATLCAGAGDPATLTLYDNTSATGTICAKLGAVTGGSAHMYCGQGGGVFTTALYASIAGTGATLTVVWD